MIKFSKFLKVLVLILFTTVTYSQTCQNPSGTWINELGSTMSVTLQSNNVITGSYISGSARGPLNGFINSTGSDSVVVYSFSVNWGNYASVTGWTGTCRMKNGVPTIKTLWNLARVKSANEWDNILAGSDTFIPIRFKEKSKK